MAASFLFLPPPNLLLLPRRFPPPPPSSLHSVLSKPSQSLSLCYSSPSAASPPPYPTVTEEGSLPSRPDATAPTPPTDELNTADAEAGSSVDGAEFSPNFRGCKTCGREEIERGCNGEGRIQGGIATVPGFGWWPIKAYRPCPAFVASGGRYRRQGQSMDEVASGRSEYKGKSSKKREEIKRLKG